VGKSLAQVEVLDFGIALMTGEVQLTRTGVVVGTPGYMAPEQARCVRHLTPAVDVSALGCVLFECLTGERAFSGDPLLALLAKLLPEEPPLLCDLRPDLPAPLSELVQRMLEKDPEKRPRDGAVVAAALGALDPGAASAPAPRLRQRERRLMSVLV